MQVIQLIKSNFGKHIIYSTHFDKNREYFMLHILIGKQMEIFEMNRPQKQNT